MREACAEIVQKAPDPTRWKLIMGQIIAAATHQTPERLRPAMEMIGAKLRALREPASGAKVVPMRKRAAKGAR